MKKIFRAAQNNGFTLIELLIVMSVVAILVSIIIPSLRGLQQEAWLTQAEKETQSLQIAVESYYRHHENFPGDITSVLQNAKPALIANILKDPWKTDGATYGYVTGNTASGESYFLVYSKGLAVNPTFTISNDKVVAAEGMVIKSNLPVVLE